MPVSDTFSKLVTLRFGLKNVALAFSLFPLASVQSMTGGQLPVKAILQLAFIILPSVSEEQIGCGSDKKEKNIASKCLETIPFRK